MQGLPRSARGARAQFILSPRRRENFTNNMPYCTKTRTHYTRVQSTYPARALRLPYRYAVRTHNTHASDDLYLHVHARPYMCNCVMHTIIHTAVEWARSMGMVTMANINTPFVTIVGRATR